MALLQVAGASASDELVQPPQSLWEGGPGETVSPAGKPADVAPPMGAYASDAECSLFGCTCRELFENVSFFGGLDGSKQPQDFGVNAEFGGRASVNWGIPLVQSIGLGAQVGTALDATGDAVQVMQKTIDEEGRTQSYTTVGLFQRTECGFNWGVAYDFLREDYYDTFSLGQWRLDVSYQFTPCTSFGIWSAISDRGDSGHYATIPVTLAPISQANLYWGQTWNGGVQTMIWGGWADGHGQANAVLGDGVRIENPFVFGAQLFVPLSDKWAIFGQGNFITPASSGTVDSYLGFAFYPFGGCRSATSRFAPLQTVAAPTNFAVDLAR
jgi:hypothetical protein